MTTKTCTYSKTDDAVCETHQCRIDGIQVSDDPVEVDGDQTVLLGWAARRYRQALVHAQRVIEGEFEIKSEEVSL